MTKKASEIIKAIQNSKNVLVCGHIRPDGDCIGSALAVRRICEKLGKNADAVCDSDKPDAFFYLPDYDKFCSRKYDDYDLFIAVDCADEKRLGEYRKYLVSAKNSVDIDHHPTNYGYAKINCIDAKAASVCALLFELFEDSGLIDKDVAEMLYTGVSTDTGHFMHSNTDAKVFTTAAKLCGYGIDVGRINHDLYRNESMNKMKLTARAIDSIRLHADGKIALMTILLDDLKACDCETLDTEGLIDYASSIAGVRISIAMCEQPGNLFRVSLRSVSADVSAVAGKFGGGGHKLASGCIINGNRYDVAEMLIKAATAALS